MASLLSSLSGSISSYLARPASDEVAPFAQESPDGEAMERLQTPPAASPAGRDGPVDLSEHDPHTPDQRNSSRLSPNSLSASGSETMRGVLSSHPNFSVFRKSSSLQSLDGVADGRAEQAITSLADGDTPASLSVHDLQEDDAVETLVTPPNQSPVPQRRVSPRNRKDGDTSVASDSSSFHLSLDSAEAHSLNFGDNSSLSLSPFPSPPAASTSASPASVSAAQTIGVRLVPDSPPAARTPAPRSRSSSAQSSRMRSSTGPVQRVQFSPLSVCPSPLVNAPPLPPPPPPPPFSPPSAESSNSVAIDSPLDARASITAVPPAPVPQSVSRPGSGILKVPRTPGTGCSVRFSASTEDRTIDGAVADEQEDGAQDSPSVVAGSRSLVRAAAQQVIAEHEGTPIARAEVEPDAVEDVSTGSALDLAVAGADDQDGGDSSSLVASFLSKLQAAIPSPDVSLATSPPRSDEAPLPDIAINPSTPSATKQQHLPLRQSADMLFDESNPFSGMHSALGASLLDRPVPAATANPPSVAPAAALGSSLSLLDGGAASADSATFLMHASLNGLAAPSFAGRSFAELSVVGQPILPSAVLPAATLHVLEEVSEDSESIRLSLSHGDATVEEVDEPTQKLNIVTPRAPNTPLRPSPLRQETTSASPLRASDASSVVEEAGAAAERGLFRSPAPVRLASPASAAPDRGARFLPPPASPAHFSIPPRDSPSSPLVAAPSTPSPALPDAPSTTAAPPPPPPPASSTASASASTSFYRQFMAARARDGLSSSAREEWTRLERGEKASPKEGSHVAEVPIAGGADESGLDIEQSVYWSPMKSFADEAGVREDQDEEEGVAELLVRRSAFVEVGQGSPDNGGIRSVLHAEEELAGESSVIEHDDERRAFLSPITEVTEPESNANTPFDPPAARAHSRDPPPAQPSFLSALHPSLSSASTSIAAVAPPATPSRIPSTARRGPVTPQSASKIPRPRNPITPSQNPFLLQLARSTANNGGADGAPNAGKLLHDLFSTQQDQLATSASQRFLLSSLVTNLQNDVDHKNALVDNLKKQLSAARDELRDVEELALAWEERASSVQTGEAPASATRKRDKAAAALEQTVQFLTDELETRVREDRQRRDELELELDRTRAELTRRTSEVRDGEIRLRHAQADVEQSEEARDAVRREQEQEVERRREAERERDELRARWTIDVEERERVCTRLREELQELKGSASPERGSAEADVEREVQRRVEAALADASRDVRLVEHELVQRDAALADMRQQLSSQRDEIDRLSRAVQEERQHAELAHADLADVLAGKETELDEVLRNQADLQLDLDAAHDRLDSIERERDDLAAAVQAKDAELAEQVSQCQSALSAMAELETAVARIEREAASLAAEVAKLQRELTQTRRESDEVLEKRDRVLAESEKAAGRAKKELEALQNENNRLSDLVGKLRRDSADREVKVTKLKKRAAELEEDVFGLNIALDAKQQEASHWKRQMSSLKLEHERLVSATADAPPTVSRAVTLSAAPSVAGTATATRRSSLRQHTTTPFPPEKRASTASLSRRSSTSSLARRSSASRVADPAISTDDDEEEHDLTLPPAAHEETPSRAPASSAAAVRRSSSAAQLGLGLPSVPRQKKASAPSGLSRSSSIEKENAAPVTARRREAVLA
ncbi:uncharacterized protein JCM10292_006558 [Rhodotorula paludigena]|uniref:uncharacterized protein n=1 Tax=Rhodotorula paludigena TaxID=86838 RepID=UPI00317B557F